MTDNHFFQLIQDIVSYCLLHDEECDNSLLKDKIFSKQESAIKLMKSFYEDKGQWEKLSYFDKVACLDLLIDQNYHNGKDLIDIPEKDMESWIIELLKLAEKEVKIDEITFHPVGKVILKRYFTEPMTQKDYAYHPCINDGEIYLFEGRYVRFVRDLLGKSDWGKEIIKAAQSIWLCAQNEIKEKNDKSN